MKITIEGWKEDPVILDNVGEFILSTISNEKMHSLNINTNIQHQTYLVRLLNALIENKIMKDYPVDSHSLKN